MELLESLKEATQLAAFKLKVVEHAKKKSKNDAIKVFSVDRKIVQEWCKQSNGNWEKCKKTLMRKTPRKTIYMLMLKLWENQEPKLDLQLSEDSDGDEELSDSIHMQPS